MSNSIWRDIKVVNNHAFIVAETYNHGMQIVDLTRLRKMNDFRVIQSDVWYPNLSKVHNIVSNEETNFVYAVGSQRRKHYKEHIDNCWGTVLVIIKGRHTVYFSSSIYIMIPRIHFHCITTGIARSSG